MTRKAKVRADCRADTRGGSWAGIPKCLIDSAAYRDLSLHARAILVELTARMNGWNNGEIAASQRDLKDALGCTPRYVVAALAELMEHGLVDVCAQGKWKERQARQYRLTFVSTKNAAATNDYLQWTPSKENLALPTRKQQGVNLLPTGKQGVVALLPTGKQDNKPTDGNLPNSESASASHGEALIYEPCPPAQIKERRGDHGLSESPPSTAGDRFDDVMASSCERCGTAFEPGGRGRPQRFCSETCRKQAEQARAYQRRKQRDDHEPQQIG